MGPTSFSPLEIIGRNYNEIIFGAKFFHVTVTVKSLYIKVKIFYYIHCMSSISFFKNNIHKDENALQKIDLLKLYNTKIHISSKNTVDYFKRIGQNLSSTYM